MEMLQADGAQSPMPKGGLTGSAWWTAYALFFGLTLGLVQMGVNLPPLNVTIESLLDLAVVAVWVVVTSWLLTSVADFAVGRRWSVRKTGAAVLAVLASLALFAVTRPSGRSLDAHQCRFGVGAVGDVWIRIEQVADAKAADDYTVEVEWGPHVAVWNGEVDNVRYLTLGKGDLFSNHPATVKVSPSAYISCGADPVPKDADATRLVDWESPD